MGVAHEGHVRQRVVVEVGGLYQHSFVRTDAGWRSRKLHEKVVWTRGF